MPEWTQLAIAWSVVITLGYALGLDWDNTPTRD